MRAFLIDLLKPFAEWVYAIVVAVPLPLVRCFFLGLLAVMALWVLTLPAQRPAVQNGKSSSWLTDLRLMAIGLLALQSIFYILL